VCRCSKTGAGTPTEATDLAAPRPRRATRERPLLRGDDARCGSALGRPRSPRFAYLAALGQRRSNRVGTSILRDCHERRSGPGTPGQLPAFTAGPPAPREDASQLIGVDNPRLSAPIGAMDPSRGGRFALWTDQAVAGGAGVADPLVRRRLRQRRSVPVRHGCRPDPVSLRRRHLSGPPGQRYNRSHWARDGSHVRQFILHSDPAIWIISNRGPAPQSAPLLVKQSPAPYLSFDRTLAGSACRWIDHPGAAPDPAANPRAPHGVVWWRGERNDANPNASPATVWGTWIFTESP
jgi:hypothetical protein